MFCCNFYIWLRRCLLFLNLTNGRDDDDGVEQRAREGPLELVLVLDAVPALRPHVPQQLLLEHLEALDGRQGPVLRVQHGRVGGHGPQPLRHVGAPIRDVLLDLSQITRTLQKERLAVLHLY